MSKFHPARLFGPARLFLSLDYFLQIDMHLPAFYLYRLLKTYGSIVKKRKGCYFVIFCVCSHRNPFFNICKSYGNGNLLYNCTVVEFTREGVTKLFQKSLEGCSKIILLQSFYRILNFRGLFSHLFRTE